MHSITLTAGNSCYHGWRHTVFIRFSGHKPKSDEKRNLAVLLQSLDETVC